MDIKLISSIKETFDEYGNKLTSVAEYGRSKKTWTYDDKGRVKTYNGETTSVEYVYDECSCLVKHANGYWEKFIYDYNGMCRETIYPNGDKSTYTYYGKTQIVTNSDGGICRYTYDNLGTLTLFENSTNNDKLHWNNEYSVDCRLISQKDLCNGKVTNYGHDDNLNQISSLHDNHEYEEILNTYDDDDNIVSTITHKFHVDNNFVVNNVNIQQRAEMGFETKLKRDTIYTFLEDGRVDKFVCNTGYWVKYNYDENGDIVSCVDSKGFGTMCI